MSLHLIGVIIILISLYIWANQYENGDGNATLMYIMIYSIPLCILSLINTSLLKFSEKIKNEKIFSLMLVFIFPIIFIILILTNDDSFKLLGRIGMMAFGIINLIWFIMIYLKPLTSKNERLTLMKISFHF